MATVHIHISPAESCNLIKSRILENWSGCPTTTVGDPIDVYADGNTIGGSSVLYKNSACTIKADTGYYYDGTDEDWYYWDGNTLTSMGC